MTGYQTTYDDGITANVAITDNGDQAVVVVGDGNRRLTSRLHHQPGGVYTDDDLPHLAELTVEHFRQNTNPAGSSATVHTRTIAGVDLIHIRDTSPPRWAWPRINIQPPRSDRWWYLGIGWRNTAHSIGIRRHHASSPTRSTT